MANWHDARHWCNWERSNILTANEIAVMYTWNKLVVTHTAPQNTAFRFFLAKFLPFSSPNPPEGYEVTPPPTECMTPASAIQNLHHFTPWHINCRTRRSPSSARHLLPWSTLFLCTIHYAFLLQALTSTTIGHSNRTLLDKFCFNCAPKNPGWSPTQTLSAAIAAPLPPRLLVRSWQP